MITKSAFGPVGKPARPSAAILCATPSATDWQPETSTVAPAGRSRADATALAGTRRSSSGSRCKRYDRGRGCADPTCREERRDLRSHRRHPWKNMMPLPDSRRIADAKKRRGKRTMSVTGDHHDHVGHGEVSPSTSKSTTSECLKTSQWFGIFSNTAGWWIRLFQGGEAVCSQHGRSLLRPVGADIFSGKSRFMSLPDQVLLSLPVEPLGDPGVAGFDSLSAPSAVAGFAASCCAR